MPYSFLLFINALSRRRGPPGYHGAYLTPFQTSKRLLAGWPRHVVLGGPFIVHR